MVKKNKKGFIRIIEAVIAVIIVFGYILTILPKEEASTGRIPPELDNTLQALLKEIQNNPEFRNKVIFGHDTETLKIKIDDSLPPFSPWKYAFKLCKAGGTNVNDCGFFISEHPETGQEEKPTFNDDFTKALISTETSVYTKSLFLSEADITAPGIATPSCSPSDPPTGTDPCANLVITFYMWSEL